MPRSALPVPVQSVAMRSCRLAAQPPSSSKPAPCMMSSAKASGLHGLPIPWRQDAGACVCGTPRHQHSAPGLTSMKASGFHCLPLPWRQDERASTLGHQDAGAPPWELTLCHAPASRHMLPATLHHLDQRNGAGKREALKATCGPEVQAWAQQRGGSNNLQPSATCCLRTRNF